MRKKTIPSNDLIKVEDATATAALSKVGHTSRRKLLTTGAGLVASAGAPAGIGALGLALPSAAQAASGTLGSKKLLWKSDDYSKATKGSTTIITHQAVVTFGDAVEYGLYIKTTFPGIFGVGAWVKEDFEPISQASSYFSAPHNDFIIRFSVGGKEKMTRRRDKLLNPLTCDEPWSKKSTTFQHRRLDDEETPDDITQAQRRRRKRLAILRAFYRWMFTTHQELLAAGIRNGLSDEINNILRYVGYQRLTLMEQSLPMPEAEIVLEGIFDVDQYSEGVEPGNASPSFFHARIRRIGTPETGVSFLPEWGAPGGVIQNFGPSDNTYFIDMAHRVRPGQDGLVYSTLVTRYSSPHGAPISMPWGPGIPLPTAQRLAGTSEEFRRYRAAAATMISGITDQDLRAAAWGAQTELLRQNAVILNNYVAAPLLLASMLAARRKAPSGSSVALTVDPRVLVASTIIYACLSALDIYRYFRRENDQIATDIANGWRWVDLPYRDDSPQDRFLIGYTYDYSNGRQLNQNWRIEGSISGVSLDHSINEGLSYVAGLPAAAVKDQKIRVKFKLSPQVFVLREFVISVSHASSAELGILVNGKKLYIQGEPDWGKRIYKITAKIASNPDDNPSPPPAVTRWTIKMNHNPVISSQAKSAGGSVFTSVPSSCAEGDSLTIRFKASGTSAEVTFRIAEPQLKTYNVFIAQPPQRFQVSATKDDATKTYTISAWLTLI